MNRTNLIRSGASGRPAARAAWVFLGLWLALGGLAAEAPAQSAESPEPSGADATKAPPPASAADDGEPVSGEQDTAQAAEKAGSRRQGVFASLTIFVLAVFVGFEVITKVPPTLHTPLMSGSNAISGITLIGALIVAAAGLDDGAGKIGRFLGMVAVALATVNVVGGFLVTHRMLAMFQKKK